MKKYELTNDSIAIYNITVYRIKAIKDFGDVKSGELGGYIAKQENLSHEGNAWVYDTAKIYGNARVYGNAKICGNSKVLGKAEIYGNATVADNATVAGDSKVYGNANITENAIVCDNAVVCEKGHIGGDSIFSLMENRSMEVKTDTRLSNNTKYVLTNNFLSADNNYPKMYRIKALKDFDDVKKGDLGGYVESERNLSQDGNCWIYDDAKAMSNAVVYGNAKLYEKSRACDNAKVYDNAKLYWNSVVSYNGKVFGNAKMFVNTRVYEDAMLFGDAEMTDSAHIYGCAMIHGNVKLSQGVEINGVGGLGDNSIIDGHNKYDIGALTASKSQIKRKSCV